MLDIIAHLDQTLAPYEILLRAQNKPLTISVPHHLHIGEGWASSGAVIVRKGGYTGSSAQFEAGRYDYPLTFFPHF